MRVLEKTPERVRLDMDAPAPTWLFLLRGYFPYREALLDGHAVKVRWQIRNRQHQPSNPEAAQLLQGEPG